MMNYLYQFYLVLLSTVFVASCNGQNKTQPKKIEGTSTPFATGQPKIIKTQGSNQYATIHCGLQDKKGNLWFATNGEGVYRYDGRSFTQFTVKDGLNDNTVCSMLEDKAGNIWLGTLAGICRYDPSAPVKAGEKIFTIIPIALTKNSYLSYNSITNDPSEKKQIWNMMQDKSGTLWFGANDGVYCYNASQSMRGETSGKTIGFTRFPDNASIINKEGLHLKMVDCMLEDKNGIIWFGSGMPPGQEGAIRYDREAGSLISLKPYGDKWIRSIIEDKKGNLVFVTRSHGVCRYDPSAAGRGLPSYTNITEQGGIGNQCTYSMLEDRNGNFWFATENGSGDAGEDGGLWRFDGTSYIKYTTRDGLSHNGVCCVIEDKNGKIWAGTRNIGLCRYDPEQSAVAGEKLFTSFSE